MEGNPKLPGIATPSSPLMEQLKEGLLSQGTEYVPRTHHLDEQGGPLFLNRLILQTSPYLLQHAHNPVNWFPWGDEAFVRALKEDKPILLSVGYSTCHWCHVMERESFEDIEIATFINEHFIAIKVDREERPDIDDIYMKAVQALTGRGGWPMTVLLTPDKKPFFGGTYFPPRDGERGAGKGFLSILKETHLAFKEHRSEVTAEAERLSKSIAQQNAEGARSGAVPGSRPLIQVAQYLERTFDATWGGFGRAPKFPRPVTLELLLRYARRAGDEPAQEMAVFTLKKMAQGGVYDQLAGGFHRYSTDSRWLVPHFEKMLYDNAQLVPMYLSAYQLTGQEQHARVARDILDYLEREMRSNEGGFYSATDADSLGPSGHQEEGYYFTWTPAELKTELSLEQYTLISKYYSVSENGNFEGRNIFFRAIEDADVATELKLSEEQLLAQLSGAKDRLYQARRRRPVPLLDDKILCSHNGLAISAFAQAAFILGEPRYLEAARQAAGFLLKAFRDKQGRLSRSYRQGRTSGGAYLDDYAFLIGGLLDLYEASAELIFLREAIALQTILDAHYADLAGGYFMTSDDHEKLLSREKPIYDGAEPSGNSVSQLNLLRLGEMTGQAEYRARAELSLSQFSNELSATPMAYPKMLSALDFYLDVPIEVFIVFPEGASFESELLDVVRRTYVPNRVLTFIREGRELEETSKIVVALEDKKALRGMVTAYVCERGRCELPTSDPQVLSSQLKRVRTVLN